MSDRPLKYRKLLQNLRRFGIDEDKARGKGSHRILFGVVDGGLIKHPIKCHNDGEEKPKAVIARVQAHAERRRDGQGLLPIGHLPRSPESKG